MHSRNIDIIFFFLKSKYLNIEVYWYSDDFLLFSVSLSIKRNLMQK